MAAESKLLMNGVWFTLRVRREQGDTTVMGVIDATGHVEVHPLTVHKADWGEWHDVMRGRRDEMHDALVDSGLADWRQVAPGESELYAEPRLLDLVQPALNAMSVGWVLL
jgi:hypothetical protein